ncbi:Gfo/Idh/MocA family oxidoreductase [Devosia sp. A8/3-2]|nr:Gfo/Idh/MocA family oxidoreductase [Devosia sp. A8/3-2]
MAHADQVIAALNAGKDVLCEKPLAIGGARARQMIEAAARNNRLLFAGHVRRQFPATNAIRDIVRSGLLGPISAVTCFEGGPFSRPVSGPGYFSRSSSGGGVLQDIGSHCTDLLTRWLGKPDHVAHEDDAFGGVEANCLVTLDYHGFRAKIRLSRDWAQPNIYRIVGAGGWLEWPVNNPRNFRFALSGGDTADTQMRAPQGDDFHRAFARQIEAALDNDKNVVSAADILPTIAMIETCYANRAAMALPWLAPDELARAHAFEAIMTERIAILGAGGFIGNRAVEMLTLGGHYEVRPVVRAAQSLALASRFVLDGRIADGRDEAALRAAFSGCDAIIHAMAGDPQTIVAAIEAGLSGRCGRRREAADLPQFRVRPWAIAGPGYDGAKPAL